jgi:hypothetical protein
MYAVLKRTYHEDRTTGELKVFTDDGAEKATVRTLELPWKSNQKQISCIPEGEYAVRRRLSAKHGMHFELVNVPGRDLILIHPANFISQLRGCIAPGLEHLDIDQDGKIDVANSKPAMLILLQLLTDFKLIIKS